MKKKSKVFNLYNFVIVICLVVIGGSIFIILNREDDLAGGLKEQLNSIVTYAQDAISNLTGGKESANSNPPSTNTNTNTNVNTNINSGVNTNANQNIDTNKQEEEDDGYGINETQAKEIALPEFIKLGEEGVTVDSLTVRGVLRGGSKYYEVSSASNNVEVRVKTGKVEWINNKRVD